MAHPDMQPVEDWCTVSGIEFQQFLRAYPRPLEAQPPASRKARYREYQDATLAPWPGNVVAKVHRWRKSVSYLVRGEFVRYCAAT